ncbi:branched-chain amino acid transport ATP-binding protein LivF-like [Tropilaelaps mercedesae]|uniref:Branched-chain amino acid transport ATP-binding protein LivF-like n=1 Tax=Tropilaelaps mercedesae TaxID=418985 RepID=A0A1V9X7M2_9ACAR|nr:branched-chain amino acid transport ATP-binding protein LivF-like [Tropilaelaps mercedesae]
MYTKDTIYYDIPSKASSLEEDSTDTELSFTTNSELLSSMSTELDWAQVRTTPVSLAWKSIRWYGAGYRRRTPQPEPMLTESDDDLLLRDVSGFANPKTIVLLAGMNPKAPRTLLRIIAGDINPHEGEVIRGGTAGLENMTVLIDPSRGDGLRSMLFEHLDLIDSIGSYVHRAIPDDHYGPPTCREFRDTVGSVYHSVFSLRHHSMDTMPEHYKTFLVLLMVLSCARKIILLDEPFIGLSVWQVNYVIRKLKSLRDSGCTVLISSSVHATILLNAADRLYIFARDGSIMVQGDPAHPEVFRPQTSRTSNFATTVSRIVQSKPSSRRKRGWDIHKLVTLPRVPRGTRDAAYVFSDIMMNEINTDYWVLPTPILCTIVFTAMCAVLTERRNALEDHLQPFVDLNIYFFLQLFLAMLGLFMGVHTTRIFLRVAQREWRNATYTLVESFWTVTCVSTTISTLCTCSLCIFIFLVTGQQRMRGEHGPDQAVISTWAPFLFVVSGLSTSYNFGRLGILLAFLWDGVANCGLMLLGNVCILVFLVTAVIPCRLFTVKGLDSSRETVAWYIAAFMSPLSAGQELMFHAVYATQGSILCSEWLPSTSKSTNSTSASCIPYAALAGIGKDKSHSFVLFPIVFRLCSVVLWLMSSFWVVSTLIWARRMYNPFLTAVPDLHHQLPPDASTDLENAV